jgi:spermidine synthase
MTDPDRPTIVERAVGRLGELALRADGGHYEIISNGVFLMDTRSGASERLLVRLALRDKAGPTRVLIGGLGVGFSLAEALKIDGVAHVTVVEIEPNVIAWGETYLAPFSDHALADPRVEIVNADLAGWLAETEHRFDAICLDVDNGPGWTVADGNGRLYTDEGLAVLAARLTPGGALTLWSAAESLAFAERLQCLFSRVEVVPVPVARGEPDVVYVATQA